MSVIAVTFIEADGTVKKVDDAVIGESLMNIAKENSIAGILGDCGGSCACATCHVLVDSEWTGVVGKPDDVEEMTLEMVGEVQETSRLCCQVLLSAEMDGLKVTVSPVDE